MRGSIRTRYKGSWSIILDMGYGQDECKRLLAEADVLPIKFHGVRHTCAPLLLQAGVPVHVV